LQLEQDEHGRVLSVAAILVAELLDQTAFFQLNLAKHSAGFKRESRLSPSLASESRGGNRLVAVPSARPLHPKRSR